MTLIHVGNSSGTVGRCDAKCYLAQDEHCDCICGGRNHGKGLRKAMDNTREHAKKILAAHPEAKAWIDSDVWQDSFL
jgi:hypothetical protein